MNAYEIVCTVLPNETFIPVYVFSLSIKYIGDSTKLFFHTRGLGNPVGSYRRRLGSPPRRRILESQKR